jgi:hypothetical protein
MTGLILLLIARCCIYFRKACRLKPAPRNAALAEFTDSRSRSHVALYMPETTPPISSNLKTWRVIRYCLFVLVYAALSVTATRIPQLQTLSELRLHDSIIALAIAMSMALVLMLAILFGGMKGFSDLTAEWKTQLFGVFSFLWSIDTCRAIGFAFASLNGAEASSSQDSIGGFVYFLFGVVVLLPLEIIAVRAYAKRKGIPIWPNLPKK